MLGLMLAPMIGAVLAVLIHSQLDWASPESAEEAWDDLRELARRQSPPEEEAVSPRRAPPAEEATPRRSPPAEELGRAAPASGKGRALLGEGRERPPPYLGADASDSRAAKLSAKARLENFASRKKRGNLCTGLWPRDSRSISQANVSALL